MDIEFQNNFKLDDIKQIILRQCSGKNPKITDEAVILMNELLKMLVVESTMRAICKAKTEDSKTISLDHVESILVHTMLDFP